ncbi:adenosylhomocysteinase [Paramicrobacterium sp. CJ85]|uniref:adenosylhomocysteinase n=1 Tax=Paramicrobacterium sp. CJ85 TaxID=3445355 RepID=UPI003F629876
MTAARAVDLLTAYNRTTNRLIAGVRFGVPGATDVDDTLRAMIRGMGGHVVDPATSDVLITSDPDDSDTAAGIRDWLTRPADQARTSLGTAIVIDGAGLLGRTEDAASSAEPLKRLLPAGLRAMTASRGDFAVLDRDAISPAEPAALIPDDHLSAAGAVRIEWAAEAMPITRALASRLAQSDRLRGVRIGIVLVLEPKTAVLAIELMRAGADVRVFAPANEVSPDAAASLRARGIVVLGSPDATPDEDAEQERDLLRWKPQLIIDDGAHLIRRAHTDPAALAELRGAAEETTSGVRPLREMDRAGELRVPVVPVNDARIKTLFDNRHGTGQTCVFAIHDVLRGARTRGILDPTARAAEPFTATWLVIGYGPVGEGVCRHARALGARVIVTDIDPVRCLAAEADGFEVDAASAVARADIVVSATGVPATIDTALAAAARPGTVFAVAGGVDGEVELPDAMWTDLDDHVSTVTLPRTGTGTGDRTDACGGTGDAHTVTVLAHGHGINYTASGGNPIEIMDLSFAAQLAAVEQLLDAGVLTDSPSIAPGLHDLTTHREAEIARLALAARGHAVAMPPPAAPQTAEASAEANATTYAQTPHADAPDAATSAAPPTEPIALLTRDTADPTQATVTVYTAPLVIPVTAPRIRNGAVAVQGDRILHVGDRRWVLQSLRDTGTDFVEEHWNGVITPGLINAHTHLQYTHMADVAARRYRGFDDWAAAFDEVYSDENRHDWKTAARDGARLAVASGTTALADVVTDREAMSALHDAGLHGIAYWEVIGWSNADWHARGRDTTISELDSMPDSPGVGVSPHAPYSLEVQPLLDVPDVVRNRGMRLHIHLAEAHIEREGLPGDEAWAELGASSFRALRRQGVGVSSTQFVDQLGVLGPDCHIAHGIYMTGRDRSLLRARGTSVALCPRSNEIIGLDEPPVAAYLREGNLICVGTDSLSSSPSLDPLADVARLHAIARDQGYAEPDLHQRLFHAVTLGGAHALGLSVGERRVGQLAVGAFADLAFFDVDATDPDDALAQLVESGAGTCRRTIVAGATVFTHEETP